MQGRKPAVKPLENVVDLPVSEARLPECPDSLKNDELMRQSWDQVTRVMVARNTFSDDCRSLVEAYSIQRARFLDNNRLAIENRGTSLHDRHITKSNVAFDRMFRIALELGLSPVMRGRAQPVRTGAASHGFLSAKKDKAKAKTG